MDALLASFDDVCAIWRATVPGCLCATVCRDPDDPDGAVHDLRIFATKADYAAHVDKTNQELTDKITRWFENYDTTTPFSGVLYGVELGGGGEKSGAADEGEGGGESSISLDSSVQATADTPTPEMTFSQFDWRDSGMLGAVPDVHLK